MRNSIAQGLIELAVALVLALLVFAVVEILIGLGEFLCGLVGLLRR